MARGGRTTKIYAIVEGVGNTVEFLLSRGNEHDSTHAIELLSKVNISKSNVLADKAYDSKSIREYISEQNAAYTIPSIQFCYFSTIFFIFQTSPSIRLF